MHWEVSSFLLAIVLCLILLFFYFLLCRFVNKCPPQNIIFDKLPLNPSHEHDCQSPPCHRRRTGSPYARIPGRSHTSFSPVTTHPRLCSDSPSQLARINRLQPILSKHFPHRIKSDARA